MRELLHACIRVYKLIMKVIEICVPCGKHVKKITFSSQEMRVEAIIPHINLSAYLHFLHEFSDPPPRLQMLLEQL